MWHFDGNLDALRTSTEVWDDDTGETVAEAFARFSDGLTVFTDVNLAVALIKAGFDDDVWSFGYGDDPKDFTTITDTDELIDDPDGSLYAWGPFGIDLRERPNPEASARFALDFVSDWSMIRSLDDVTGTLLVEGANTLARALEATR